MQRGKEREWVYANTSSVFIFLCLSVEWRGLPTGFTTINLWKSSSSVRAGLDTFWWTQKLCCLLLQIEADRSELHIFPAAEKVNYMVMMSSHRDSHFSQLTLFISNVIFLSRIVKALAMMESKSHLLTNVMFVHKNTKHLQLSLEPSSSLAQQEMEVWCIWGKHMTSAALMVT